MIKLINTLQKDESQHITHDDDGIPTGYSTYRPFRVVHSYTVVH